MPLKTFPYDSVRFLDSREAIDDYMDEVRQTGDPKVIARALSVVARAERVHKLERRA